VRSDLLEPDEWSTRDLGHAVWTWILDRSLPGVRREDFVTLTAPGRMVAVYPVDEGRTAAFLVHRSPDGGGEPDAELPGTLHRRFDDLDWLVPELLAAFPSAVDRYTDRTVQVRARVWHRGRVALLGDACWCVSLLAGQGASLALAGGATVAEELATVSDVADVPAALDRARERLGPLVTRLADSGARTASWFVPEERWRMTVRDTTLRASTWPVVGPCSADGSASSARPRSPVLGAAGRRRGRLDGMTSSTLTRARTRIPSALLVAVGLAAGFGVAQGTGIRALGGAVFALGGLGAAWLWVKHRGWAVALGLGALYIGAFVLAHVLALGVGMASWLAVALVTLVAAGVTYAVADRS
jgi:hypothetical protein